MPDFQLRHLNPCFIFEPLHERVHFMAMGSLRTGELQQIKFFFHNFPPFFTVSLNASLPLPEGGAPFSLISQRYCHSCESRNPESLQTDWIPPCPGMTGKKPFQSKL